MGKVIHRTIGDNTERDALAHLGVKLHQAVDGIVEGRVATGDDDSAVTVVDHHLDQSVHATSTLAVHVVIVYAMGTQHTLDDIPSRLVAESVFGAIDDSPFVFVDCHFSTLLYIRAVYVLCP